MSDVPQIDLELARRVLQIEADAISALRGRIGPQFERAVQVLLNCRGRVVVTGMGKSGIVCRKIAATLSSTGTPAFFLHPAEAVHGDLGALHPDDVVLALSNTGETHEILRLLEAIKRLGAMLIALTGEVNSTLGHAADVVLDCHVSEEACPMNLVPTASTTAALALGDALAMTLLVAKGFKLEDFASRHPAGKLGKRLMRIEQVMHGGDDMPRVSGTTTMSEVIYEMSRKGLGMTTVCDDGRLIGIITDGDLRRHMATKPDFLSCRAGDVMTTNPVTISRNQLVMDVVQIFEQRPPRRKITSVVVVDGDGRAEGVVHMHDLWRGDML